MVISVSQFSCSVVSASLRPHGLQHARPPCPSLNPGACSNSCPLSCDAIQPSHPLSSPSPAFSLSQHQGLFQCQFFASGGQSIGVLALAAVLPMNIQGLFPLGLTGLLQQPIPALLLLCYFIHFMLMLSGRSGSN